MAEQQSGGHIFISYGREQQKYARKLANYLIENGFNVWIDDRINYGADWWDAIVKAIEDCAAFIILMTPDSQESRWVKRECQLAEKFGKITLPLLLEGLNWPL